MTTAIMDLGAYRWFDCRRDPGRDIDVPQTVVVIGLDTARFDRAGGLEGRGMVTLAEDLTEGEQELE